MVIENFGLQVEPKLNAIVEAARYIVQSGERTSSFMFEVESHPELVGLLRMELHLGTLMGQIEDGHSVLKFFLRYGAPSVSYTNLTNPAFQEVACLYQPSGRTFRSLDSAFRVIVHAARALHYITEFQSLAQSSQRQAPKSGIQVKHKFQVLSLPGKRVA